MQQPVSGGDGLAGAWPSTKQMEEARSQAIQPEGFKQPRDA